MPTTIAPVLFHGTLKEFSVGQKVIANQNVSAYPAAAELLDRARPPKTPSRQVAVFATDSKVGAMSFIESNQAWSMSVAPSQSGRLYQVRMSIAQRAPFALVHALARRIEHKQPTDGLVREYWNPTLSWNFWEYFGPSYEVISLVTEANQPTDMEKYTFSMSYNADLDRAKSI